LGDEFGQHPLQEELGVQEVIDSAARVLPVVEDRDGLSYAVLDLLKSPPGGD
jgi:hypothetical protein